MIKIGCSSTAAESLRVKEKPIDVPYHKRYFCKKSNDSDTNGINMNHTRGGAGLVKLFVEVIGCW
ncbi:hypothetical protein MiSe_66170 [Microseira wollei NIES-4236]|uniref:Transposase n=1 Tax=Microseira wollei NIES-4236 TaxID=2530354 RepID=A0AAV3XJN7_9CYAN|nr:hypothetical protein MiSe_66170 [Microseira wollei NIES-4236]